MESVVAPRASAEQRSPPTSIKVLLPLWGRDFVGQFLRVTLPTLLAPGNLPAVARTLPTELIFLTSHEDQATVRASAGFRRLSAVCDVDFKVIDELITEGNHSTTVTLAYIDAVREAGAAMLDTCFLFLVSDYIVADGSLASVVDRMMAGASGVQAGNFQIAAEEAAPWLDEELERSGDVLVLPPRQLMRRALTCIHPTTIANTVNVPVLHNGHANRLFWRVDADTLIGRFYLMHMICVRPEKASFAIGASCDYSFIPEMCPSGNVAVLTDSDDYLVIEMQPSRHEADFARLGPLEPKLLAANLSGWTTALHRQNVGHALVFHAADVPSALPAVAAEADAFIDGVTRLLKPRPQPHRGHPHWRGAMAAFHLHTGLRPDDDDLRVMLGRPIGGWSSWLRCLSGFAVGHAPMLRPWHPRWSDFRAPVAELRRLVARDARILSVSGLPTALTNWLADGSDNVRHISLSRVLQPDFVERYRHHPKHEACLLDIRDDELDLAHPLIDRLLSILKPNAEILIVAHNPHWLAGPEQFEDRFIAGAPRFFHRLDVALEEIHLVGSSRSCWRVNRALAWQVVALHGGSPLAVPVRLFRLSCAALLALAANLARALRGPRPHGKARVVSSVVMRLRVAPAPASVAGGIEAGDRGSRSCLLHQT